MQLTVDTITRHLPTYLSADRREGIVRELRNFPRLTCPYIDAYRDEYLQGDCWAGLVALNFADGSRKAIRGMVLSNSCDVEPANAGNSPLPTQLMFVPVVRLEAVAQTVRDAGRSEEATQELLGSIRRQERTEYFYLPPGAGLQRESVAWLAQVHTMPFDAVRLGQNVRKLATLSDITFYLLVLKLSIHFCRLHEGVDRSPPAEVAVVA
jgi:hypothetical protein